MELPTITPTFVTIQHAARLCSLSEKSIRRLIAQGDILAYRPLDRVLINRDSLMDHIEANPAVVPAEQTC